MRDESVTFKTAILAKKIKFGEECTNYYGKSFANNKKDNLWYEPEGVYNNKTTLACPTQNLLQRWLREKHNIHIALNNDDLNWNYQLFDLTQCNEEYNHLTGSFAGYKSYEEALEEGLYQALTLIKEL